MWLLICGSAFIASLPTFFSGFGLGTLLMRSLPSSSPSKLPLLQPLLSTFATISSNPHSIFTWSTGLFFAGSAIAGLAIAVFFLKAVSLYSLHLFLFIVIQFFGLLLILGLY